MSKKVLVLSTEFRKNGDSDRMAQEFAKGATEAGHEVEQVYPYTTLFRSFIYLIKMHVVKPCGQGLWKL